MEDGKLIESDKGTPQGGLISPILANVYLHYVLDLWFTKGIKPNLKGEAYLVRYADDFIVMFQYEEEAKAFYKLLKERMEKSLVLNLQKIRQEYYHLEDLKEQMKHLIFLDLCITTVKPQKGNTQ